MDITVEVRFHWLFKVYLQSLDFLCEIMGASPDMEKVSYWAQKAVSIKLKYGV